MARMIFKNNQTWEQAQLEAERSGIVLTRRPHKKGGYVCYANKQLRESLQLMVQLRQLPQQGYLLAGKIN